MKLQQLFETPLTLAQAQKLTGAWLMAKYGPTLGMKTANPGPGPSYYNAKLNQFAINLIITWLAPKEIVWVLVSSLTGLPDEDGQESLSPLIYRTQLRAVMNGNLQSITDLHSDPEIRKKMADKVAAKYGKWVKI